MPNMYPVSLNIAGRCCVVIGAGKVAQRKVLGLLDAGAAVMVVGFEPSSKIQELADAGRIVLHARGFVPSDLDGCWLVVAATDDDEVNHHVAEVAKKLGILCGLASGGVGDFTAPAVLNQGDLQVAISTQGASPAYARLLRDYLERILVIEHAEVLSILKEAREFVKGACANDHEKRQKILHSLTFEDMVDDVQAGRIDQVKQRISQCLLLLQD